MKITNLYHNIKNRVKSVSPRKTLKFAYGKFEDGVAFTYRNSKKALKNKYVQGITGAVSAGIIGYNLYSDGFDRGDQGATENMADFYGDMFSTGLTTEHECNLLESAKAKVRGWMLDSRAYPAYQTVKGRIGGVIDEAMDNTINLTIPAIGGIAYGLLGKQEKNKTLKKYLLPISTGILLFKGARTAIVDILGFGKDPL